MRAKLSLCLVALVLCLTSQVFSFGEPPEYDKSGKTIRKEEAVKPATTKPVPSAQSQPAQSVVSQAQPQKKSGLSRVTSIFKRSKAPETTDIPEATAPQAAATVSESSKEPTATSKEILQDLEDRYFKATKEARYAEALAILNGFPANALNDKKIQDKRRLQVMNRAETDSKTETSDLFKAEELDVETERTVRRLYKEAQIAYFNGENDLGKDLLIHILHLQRRNILARKFLEYGWDLRPGMYTVEDMEAKYWRKSSISFYGGQYLEAVQSLNVLTHINNQNALVYERLGSSYYQLAETKKAIDAWKTALFLNPNSRDLPGVIKKAEDVMKEEEKLTQERNLEKTKKTTTKTTKKTRLMSSFKEQTQAYSYAAELKKNGFDAFVEENDAGRWEVRIILGENQ